jgi:outer membrane protein TolC
MRRTVIILAAAVLAAFSASAETYTLSLKQAVARALTQNPEVVMARLDQIKSELGVRLAINPFTPRVGIGTGLAYTNGFPLSIEGAAPAIFQARATQALYNRPQSYAVAQAKETARGAVIAEGEKKDEIAYRVASLYIDADRAGRLADEAQKQVESLKKVLDAFETRVEEGRELPVAAQEAKVNLLRAQQRLVALQSDREYAVRSLAVTLGYSAEDMVNPVQEEVVQPAIPPNEEAAIQTAISSSKELKRLESNYKAKGLEVKGNKAQHLPKIDLIAQYALLSKYNNYQRYFASFSRNNGELGASIEIPIYAGVGAKALIQQAENDQQHISREMEVERNKISLDLHQSYLDIHKSDVARELAQADLDLARSQLSVLLAQMNEGRASMSQIEQARFNENEKWIAFYDAQFNDERARLNVLRQTGELMAVLQ